MQAVCSIARYNALAGIRGWLGYEPVYFSLNKGGIRHGRQNGLGVFHRAARRPVSECVLEKVETVEVCRPNSLPRGLVERWKFHGARTNALALARRFAAAGFSFVKDLTSPASFVKD